MSARDQILASVRKSLGRGPLTGEAEAPARDRLAAPVRNLIPDRTAGRDRAGLVALLVEKCRETACSVDEVRDMSAVPSAVQSYLTRENLPARLTQAPAFGAGGDAPLDWTDTPTLEVATGGADGSEDTSLTPVLAAVAETGTLVLVSGSETPTGLNFLPETHIAVVRASQVVGPLEDAWTQLRGAGAIPRTVNLITGPSRTGDIEQKIQMGVHGPRRLHVIVVAD